MTVLYPIAYPISLILDYLFVPIDSSKTYITRMELEALIMLETNKKYNIYNNNIDNSDNNINNLETPMRVNAAAVITKSPAQNLLRQSELNIMTSLLKLAGTTLIDVLIPLKNVFSLQANTVLDKKYNYKYLF